jgi:hypothetical protein
MCFSAPASFVAGGLLTVAGALALRKNEDPAGRAFAAIPLLFGIQQLSEGFLWLALTGDDFASMKTANMFAFLFFAQVLWPAWVPWAVRRMERDSLRRRILLPLMITGFAVSAYLAAGLLWFFRPEAALVGHHIYYEFNHPVHLAKYSGIFYFIPTVLPTFFSSHRRVWILGFLTFISFVVTKLFFGQFVISVWCYFAAAMSLAVLAVFPLRRVAVKGAEALPGTA